MSLQDLPLEILLEIAKLQPWVGCELSKTVRKVGLASLENDVKRWFKVEQNDRGTNVTFILAKSSHHPYYKKLLHSWDDAPAMTHSYGFQQWYKEGRLYRDNDFPAIIFPDGTKHWYKEGKLHRDDDKPAIIEASGTKIWFKEGKCHRDGNKPAQEWL